MAFTFDEHDGLLFNEFKAAGHSDRTLTAFRDGVVKGATSRAGNPYATALPDYHAAWRFGRRLAMDRIRAGWTYKCRCCGAKHRA